MTARGPAGSDPREQLSAEEIEELGMYLNLAGFEALLPPDVNLAESHRIAFCAGWYARSKYEED